MPSLTGYPTAQELDDLLQDVEPTNRDVDPAGYIYDFAIPGVPVAVQSRASERGRAGDQGTVQQAYMSKGVLPL